jgi:hypothetical protein
MPTKTPLDHGPSGDRLEVVAVRARVLCHVPVLQVFLLYRISPCLNRPTRFCPPRSRRLFHKLSPPVYENREERGWPMF